MRRGNISYSLILLSAILLISSCQSYRLEKKLNPDEQEFLSKVRFIITKEERKVFLRLPESERKAFIEEFWAKRDPDPFTEENEFKIEYFFRIERATHLFRGEGREGWLTDRGRIYILFGPPHSRKTFQPDPYLGQSRASEIWYYGNFPIFFIDRLNNGVFELVTTSLGHLSEINYALRQFREEHEKQAESGEVLILDFNIELTTSSNIPILLFKVPYNKIWLAEKETLLVTTLSLSIKVLDDGMNTVLEHSEDYALSLTEEDLKDKAGQDYTIEIPVLLAKGEYVIRAELTNMTGGKSVQKKFKVTI